MKRRPKVRRKLGNLLESALKPFVELSDKHLGTHLKGCASCQKRKEFLNNLTESKEEEPKEES